MLIHARTHARSQLPNNHLTGSLPSSLGQCMELVEITLGNNALSNAIPESFAQLPKLQVLYVQQAAAAGVSRVVVAELTTSTRYDAIQQVAIQSLVGQYPGRRVANAARTGARRQHAHGSHSSVARCFRRDVSLRSAKQQALGHAAIKPGNEREPHGARRVSLPTRRRATVMVIAASPSCASVRAAASYHKHTDDGTIMSLHQSIDAHALVGTITCSALGGNSAINGTFDAGLATLPALVSLCVDPAPYRRCYEAVSLTHLQGAGRLAPSHRLDPQCLGSAAQLGSTVCVPCDLLLPICDLMMTIFASCTFLR